MHAVIEDENQTRNGYVVIIKSNGYVLIEDEPLRPIRNNEKISPIIHSEQKLFEYDEEDGLVFDLSYKPSQEKEDATKSLTEEHWSALLQYYS